MLKIGKIPENILNRSVLKRIHSKDSRLQDGPKVGNDAAVVRIDAGELISLSSKPVVINYECDIDRGIYGVINNICAQNGQCICLEISLLLPEGSIEDDIKCIMSRIDSICKKKAIFVAGGHTEVTKFVNKPVLNITAMGRLEKDDRLKGAKPGDDIVLTKYVALEGSSLIAREKEEELKRRFSPAFVDRAIAFIDYMDVSREAYIGGKNGASSMHDASTGGIFGSLWELGHNNNVGIKVDLLSIPFMQESIEICEEYGINPYELTSAGCLIITTPNGKSMVEALNEDGIEATIVGKIASGNDRVLLLNDEKRFLEPRRNEELYKIIN